MVRPGLYQEGLVLDKAIEISGDGPVEDIVIESTDADCILMQTDYAVVRGLTLRGRMGLQVEAGFRRDYCAVSISQGRLVLENCDVTSDGDTCIEIRGATTDPVIRSCKVHGGQVDGVFVYLNGHGTIVDCDIFANLHGVSICEGGNPIVSQCRINHNEDQAVWIFDNGAGTIEDCDLTGNGTGAWLIEDGCTVTRRGNKED